MTRSNSADPIVQVGLVQMQMTNDVDENLRRACAFVRQAAGQGGQIICLPELFRSLYFCQSEDHDNFALAETIPGPATEQLSDLAKELNVAIVASLFERRTAGLYHNTTAVLDADGSYLGKYRKMHIPDDPLFYEKFYFTPGDLGFKTFRTRFGAAGVLICWDQWYPEAARLTALQGAEMLFYPTAIGWHPAEREAFGQAQHESWELIQRSHAVANGCYVISVNRTGHEGEPGGGIDFWGQSFVAEPSGQIVARASSDKEEVLVVPIDKRKIEFARTHWPFLRDRRIDAYGPIVKRWLDAEPQL
ncbi:MAG: carbon-nitrogen hydrolase [Planctomycetales bacterium]|nr:carbon-nitrogen hydrolase [Planctomycetales bacterium]